jgi:uncharacterized Zn finger protein
MERSVEVSCEFCGQRYKLEEGVVSFIVAPSVKQYGVKCPHCGVFTHSYFETDRIIEERQKLNRLKEGKIDWERIKTQQAVYKRVFADEQKRWRRKRSPAVVGR